MRDPERINEIIKALERNWKANPDLRLGQLITIAIKPNKSCPEIFYAEDEKILEGLNKYEQKRL